MPSPPGDTEQKTPAKQANKGTEAAMTPGFLTSSEDQSLDRVVKERVAESEVRSGQEMLPLNARYGPFSRPYPELWNNLEHQVPDTMAANRLPDGNVKDGQNPPPFDTRYGPFGHPYYPQLPYHGYYGFPPMPTHPAWYSHGPSGCHPSNWPPQIGNGVSPEEWHRQYVASGLYPTSGDYGRGNHRYDDHDIQHRDTYPEKLESQKNEDNPITTDIPLKNTATDAGKLEAGDACSGSGLSSKLNQIKLDASVPALTKNSQILGQKKRSDPMTPVSMKIEESPKDPTVPDGKIEKYEKNISYGMPARTHNRVDNVSNYTGLGSSVDMRRPTGYTLDMDQYLEPTDQPLASDIRGSIGPPHDLQLSGDGKIFKHAWTDDPALTLSSESYVFQAVQAWQASVQPARNIDFKELTKELVNRSDCDFDPAELEFKSPLESDETKTRSDNPMDMDSKRNRKMKAILQRRIKEDRARIPAVPREVLPQEAFEPPFACHMRPAAEEDLASVKEIYDLEITQGTQARDKVKIPSQSYNSLLQMCQERSLPFIVAVAGAPHDVRNGKTPEVAWQSKEPRKGTILGFSFLSPYHRGFCNGLNSAGDSSVRIDVMIHPEYRARFIGTALIDKMLQLICPRYNYMDTCQFVDDSAVPLYRGAHTSLHRFYHIYTDVLVAGDHDPNAKRYEKLLKDRFGFEKLFVIQGSHQHKTGMLDLVSYHKKCRPIPGAEHSEKTASLY